MIYMKKLVAISVLFAILTVAVFAQDESKWKVGFQAEFVTDMLYATDMSGKSETTTATGTTSSEFGAFNKGTINWFQNRNELTNFDNRLKVSLGNNGDNYEIYGEISLDGWANDFTTGQTIGNFLLSGSPTEWWAKGTAGIFNGQVGTAGYGGWASPRSTWNDWYGWNAICKFGLRTADGTFVVGDDFRTQDEWGQILALGIGLGDSFKLSLGYRFNPKWNLWVKNGDAADSRSSINGSFMLNGRVSDGIAFDLFYSVVGQDLDTFTRPVGAPQASWNNIIGAYVGIDAIDNLGLSLGYTANFKAYENGGYTDPSDATKTKPATYTAPFYSGVDIRLSYSGIDKIGLTLNNNITFAGVKGKEQKTDGTTEEYIYSIIYPDYSPLALLNDKQSEDWFHLESELKASLGFIDGVGLTLQLGNRLGVTSSEDTTSGASSKVKRTENEFRVSLAAEHGDGPVTFGAGLFLSVRSKALESETNYGTAVTTKASSDVTTFGIPIYFKVAF
jgi:hypothetical protein